ncbi:MAG: ABC transporter permease [Candidatus Omnitrophica bacterium]|jgi:ABC-2 type transport system permease protein|nr:ABC transporter permease [Candidatus Omnitrophota bacterium]MDD5691399.1 ABC transporter permease [Candidatus Omnitrophota bacterium]
MFERIKAILIKEFKQVLRDPRMKTVIIISPIIQIIIFGYAANKDIDFIPTAIYDQDNTKESRLLLDSFTYSKYFVPKYYIHSEGEEDRMLDKGLVSAVLRIDRGFGRNIKAGKDANVQLALDGSDSNTAMIIAGYANTIINTYQYNLLKSDADTMGVQFSAPSVDLRDRAWFNENLISRNYYLPGVIASIVTIMSLLLTSMAIVREKEIGTMEQLIVSPLRPLELIFGKLLPFGVIALFQCALITTLGVLWFHIPFRGSLVLLVLATCVYLFTALGIGLFISTIASTQQEAMMSVFLFYMPTFLLSGFAYPIANMPEVIQYFTLINPMRYYLIIIRGIFLKGVGIDILWTNFLVLLLFGIFVITMSTLRFQKKIA